MAKRHFLGAALLLTALTACGGDDEGVDDADGGEGGIGDAGTDGGGAAAIARLQSGPYSVSNIVKQSDECGIALEDGFTTTNVTAIAGELSLGTRYESTPPGTNNVVYMPAGYGFGTGAWETDTMATLRSAPHIVDLVSNCQFDATRTTAVTFVGDNQLAVDYTNVETNHSTQCGLPAGSTCMSRYRFDLTRMAP